MNSDRVPSTFRFGRCGTTMFLVFGREKATDADWSRWVQAYSDATVEHGVRGLIVVSRGGGPNARQQNQIRAALVERLDREALDIRTAVCSDHLAARLITEAIAWLSGAIHMQSFRYEDRPAALRYLQVPETAQPEILQALQRAERELDGSTLARRPAAERVRGR